MSTDRGWKLTLARQTRRLYLKSRKVYACSKDGLYESADGGASWVNLFSGDEVKALSFGDEKTVLAAAKGIYESKRDWKWERIIAFSEPIEVRELRFEKERLFVIAREGIFLLVGESLVPQRLLTDPKIGREIDLQKVITDIHTGEFFGRYFYLLMDFSALGLVVISITGFYLWYKPAFAKKTITQIF